MYYLDLLGKSFEYGGVGPSHYDCKGLVFELYRRERIAFPHYESTDSIEEQHKLFTEGLAKHAIEIDKPESYCLVMFKIRPPYVSHIGVVMKDCQKFIHIMPKSSVSVERLDSPLWINKIAGFYRLQA